MVRRKSVEASSSKKSKQPADEVVEKQKAKPVQDQRLKAKIDYKKQENAVKVEEEDDDEEDEVSSESMSSVSSVSSSESDVEVPNKPKTIPATQVLSSTRNDVIVPKTTNEVNKRKSTAPKKKTRALGEIKRLQNTTHNLIPRAPFLRLVSAFLCLTYNIYFDPKNYDNRPILT